MIEVAAIEEKNEGSHTNHSIPLTQSIGDDDVEFVGGNATVASEMPHARESCTKFSFSAISIPSNMNFCGFCYCYVCETLASDCSEWPQHCHASYKVDKWRTERKVRTSPIFSHLVGKAKAIFTKKHSKLLPFIAEEFSISPIIELYSDDDCSNNRTNQPCDYPEFDGEYLETLVNAQLLTVNIYRLFRLGFDLMQELRAGISVSSDKFEDTEEFKFLELHTIALICLRKVMGHKCRRLWDSSSAALVLGVVLNPRCTAVERQALQAFFTEQNLMRMGRRCLKLRSVQALIQASEKDFESLYKDEHSSIIERLRSVAAQLPQILLKELIVRKLKATVMNLLDQSTVLPSARIFAVLQWIGEDSASMEYVNFCLRLLETTVESSSSFTAPSFEEDITRNFSVRRRENILLLAALLDLQLGKKDYAIIFKYNEAIIALAGLWANRGIPTAENDTLCKQFIDLEDSSISSRTKQCIGNSGDESKFAIILPIVVFSLQHSLKLRFGDLVADRELFPFLSTFFIKQKYCKEMLIAIANGIVTYRPPFAVDEKLMAGIARVIVVHEFFIGKGNLSLLKNIHPFLISEIAEVPPLFPQPSPKLVFSFAKEDILDKDLRLVSVERDLYLLLRIDEQLNKEVALQDGKRGIKLLLSRNDLDIYLNVFWREFVIYCRAVSAAIENRIISISASKRNTLSDNLSISSDSPSKKGSDEAIEAFGEIWTRDALQPSLEWFEEFRSCTPTSDPRDVQKINIYCLNCMSLLFHPSTQENDEVLHIVRTMRSIFCTEEIVQNWDDLGRSYGWTQLGAGSSTGMDIFKFFWSKVLVTAPIFNLEMSSPNFFPSSAGAMILLGFWDKLKAKLYPLTEKKSLLFIRAMSLLTEQEFSCVKDKDEVGYPFLLDFFIKCLGENNDASISLISQLCSSNSGTFLAEAISYLSEESVSALAENFHPYFLAKLRVLSENNQQLIGQYNEFKKLLLELTANVLAGSSTCPFTLVRLALCCCAVNAFDMAFAVFQKFDLAFDSEVFLPIMFITNDIELLMKEFEPLIADLYLDASVPAKLQLAFNKISHRGRRPYTSLLRFYHQYDLASFEDLLTSIEESDLNLFRQIKNWMQKMQTSERLHTKNHIQIQFRLLSSFEIKDFLNSLAVSVNDMKFDKDEAVIFLLQKSTELSDVSLPIFVCVANILLSMERLKPSVREALRDTLSTDVISFFKRNIPDESAYYDPNFVMVHLLLFLNNPLSEHKYLDRVKQCMRDMFESKKDKILSLCIDENDFHTTMKVLIGERSISTILQYVSNKLLPSCIDETQMTVLSSVLRHVADNITMEAILADNANSGQTATLESQIFDASSTIREVIKLVIRIQDKIRLMVMIGMNSRGQSVDPRNGVLKFPAVGPLAEVQASLQFLVDMIRKVTASELIFAILSLCISFIPANIVRLFNLCQSLGFFDRESVRESFAEYQSDDEKVKYGLTRNCKLIDWIIHSILSLESTIFYDVEKLDCLFTVYRDNLCRSGVVPSFSGRKNFSCLVKYVVEDRMTKFYNCRDNKVEISRKGMLFVSFKKAKNTQVAELLLHLMQRHGLPAVLIFEPLFLNRMNDCNISTITNFTVTSYQSTFQNSIINRKEFRQVIDVMVKIGGQDLIYISNIFAFKDIPLAHTPLNQISTRLTTLISTIIEARRADIQTGIGVIAAISMHHILCGQGLSARLFLLFFKYDDLQDPGPNRRKPFFSDVVITEVVSFLVANCKSHLCDELLNSHCTNFRAVEVSDIVKQPLLLKEVTVGRQAQDIINKGTRNLDLWDNVLRSAEPQVKMEFCGYLLDCLRNVIYFAQSHTIGNSTKNLFKDIIGVFFKLAHFIREHPQNSRRLQSLVVESRKVLKNKKAVIEIIKVLDESTFSS